MSVILCSVAIFTSAYTFSDTNESSFKDHASNIAYTAAVNIDGDLVKKVVDMVYEQYRSFADDEIVTSDEWGSPEFDAFVGKYGWITEMPEYLSVLDYLKNIQNTNISTLSSIYLMVYDNSREVPYALYVADAAEEDPCIPGVIDTFDEEDDFNVIENPDDGITPYVAHYDQYGWLVVTGAPIYDSNGDYAALMCVDLSMDGVKTHEYRFIITLTILLVVVTFILGAAYLIIIVKNIVEPINKLSMVASDYIHDSEKKATFESVNIKRNDEIGNLTQAMKKMEHNLGLYINDLTRVTAEKERLGAELGVATRIQADMLPNHFPKRDDFSLYATMTPAKEVGGDFYDFFAIDEDHIGLVMADVSGKGVPAALFMVITKTLIKNRALMGGDPAEVLYDVNNQLCENNASGLFVTVWFGILDLHECELVCANAGHDYPAVMNAGGEYELFKTENLPPLAAVENMQYICDTIHLEKSGRLFFYTDGVPEAKAEDGSRFSLEKMIATLNRDKDLHPKELLESMKKEIDDFVGDEDTFDDITMMSVEWKCN